MPSARLGIRSLGSFLPDHPLMADGEVVAFCRIEGILDDRIPVARGCGQTRGLRVPKVRFTKPSPSVSTSPLHPKWQCRPFLNQRASRSAKRLSETAGTPSA